MRTHLTAVDGVDFAHLLLDERVAGLAEHRLTPVLLHYLDGIPGQSRVVNDARTAVAAQKRFGEQADQIIAFDEAAVRVEKEASIIVPIPGEADVGPGIANSLDGAGPVLLQHRVGYPIGKRTIGPVIDLDELKRQTRLELIDDQSGAAVPGVDDHLEGLEC